MTGNLARYEAWYASLLHMDFRAIGVDVRSEAATSHGRADMVVRTGGQVFVLEFKMAESADDAGTVLAAAFTQMRARGYADTYHGKTFHLIAVACGREARNLLEVRAETRVIT
ncbi:MAG: PD-(D/E)XK nuclease domain-containing protein [Rhodobacteraceae bacterium]|nr:PD-(D/E)XK nuclease domain-containing protein [Paracoccaceae bacterium]